jgi:hypothetical protein
MSCAAPSSGGGSGGSNGSGGNSSSGGSNGSGGNNSSGGSNGSGGSSSSGGSNGSGGSVSSGGSNGSGGAKGGSNGSGGSTSSGGNSGSGGSTSSGGNSGSGGSTSSGGTNGSGGSTSSGGTNGTGGAKGGSSGTGGAATGGAAGGAAGNCSNTDQSTINIDASGYICGNQWGIKGAWYCYSSDSSNACNKTGAIPYTSASNGMCLSGTLANSGTALLGFKVNSGPPGGGDTPGSWNASSIVGFAITMTSGASGKGSGGSVVYIEYPTTKNVLSNGDAPGVTVPGVAGSSVTYNALFSDSVLTNSTTQNTVDPTVLTDVKIAIPYDPNSRQYDLCITKVVPLMTAPSPVVPASSAYGPAWTNELAQAANGINGYAVQTAPFATNGTSQPISMQVNATSGGVGFTYKAGAGSSNNSPAEFPAVISGWGPGEVGGQFYGPDLNAKSGRTIGGTNKLTSVVSSWSFSMGGTGDAVYDVWFGNSANPAKPQTELMVWIGNTGKMPLGSTTNNTFMGKTAYTASDNGTGQQVVSYWVASPGANSTSNIDLLPYFQDAVSHNYAGLTNNSYLLGVQAGFEVYDTGTWKTTDYNIKIQ